MAITIKTLKGTNSVSADRITINDNFNINTNAINGLLGIVNTTTGKIDNTGVGADNTITTDGITIKSSGIDVLVGDIQTQNGNIKASLDGSYVELGSSQAQLKQTVLGATGASPKQILDLPNFDGLVIPKLTTVEMTEMSVELLLLGATGPNVIAFETDTNIPKFWNGSVWTTFS